MAPAVARGGGTAAGGEGGEGGERGEGGEGGEGGEVYRDSAGAAVLRLAGELYDVVSPLERLPLWRGYP